MPRSKAQPHRRRELRHSPVGKNGMKTKIPWKKMKVLIPFWKIGSKVMIFSVWFVLLGKNPMETEWMPMILRWFCRILWFHDDTGQCYPELKASSPVRIYHVHFHQRSLLESYPTKGNFPKTSPNQQDESTSSPSKSLKKKQKGQFLLYGFSIWVETISYKKRCPSRIPACDTNRLSSNGDGLDIQIVDRCAVW